MKAKSAMLLALLALSLSAGPALGSSAFTVTLANGNVVEANSYSIRDGRVYLRYPMGEASFPARQVTSIRSADGSVELLQSQGRFLPDAKPATAAAPDKPSVVHGRGDLNPRRPADRPRPVRHKRDDGDRPAEATASASPPRQADPRADELSRLLDSADADDEKKQQEIDRKMDAIFEDQAGKPADFSQIKGRKSPGASK